MTNLCDVKGCPQPQDPECQVEVFVPWAGGRGWGSPRGGLIVRVTPCRYHHRILTESGLVQVTPR